MVCWTRQMSTDTPRTTELNDEEADVLLDRLLTRADEREDVDLSRLTQSGVTRRTLIGGMAAAAGVGALTGNVSAAPDWGNTSGNVGTEANPFSGGYIQNLTTQTLNTDELSVTQGRGLLDLPAHHINYSSGLTTEELARFTLETGEKLEVWRLEGALKGGGSNANVTLDIYDATNSSVLGSVTGGERKEGTTTPLGTSGSGATILVRLSTGSTAVDLCPTGLTSVVKA